MTKHEAEKYTKLTTPIIGVDAYLEGYDKGYDKGLNVIDKVRAEIKTEISDYEGCADFYEGIRFGLRTALEIIDKHIAGKENV